MTKATLVAAADAFERAVADFEACGEVGWAQAARLWLALSDLDVGRTAAAVELLERIRPTETSGGWFSAVVHAADARVALLRGDVARAREVAIEGSSYIDAGPTHRNGIRALEALGDVLAAAGDVDAARVRYEDARSKAHAKEDRLAEARLRTKIGFTGAGD